MASTTAVLLCNHVCACVSFWASLRVLHLCILIRQRAGSGPLGHVQYVRKQMKRVFVEDLWNADDLPRLQLDKDCWHRGGCLQTYLSNRDLIHACTESHCDPLPPGLCSHVLSPFRWKINYSSFISKPTSPPALTQTGLLCLQPTSHLTRRLFINGVNGETIAFFSAACF